MQLPEPETCRRLAVDVAPRWVWFAGMAVTFKDGFDRVAYISKETGAAYIMMDSSRLSRVAPGAVPDLTDPVTAAGALLVARAAWGGVVWTEPRPKDIDMQPDWRVFHMDSACAETRAGDGPTELEALIAAILAAPEK